MVKKTKPKVTPQKLTLPKVNSNITTSDITLGDIGDVLSSVKEVNTAEEIEELEVENLPTPLNFNYGYFHTKKRMSVSETTPALNKFVERMNKSLGKDKLFVASDMPEDKYVVTSLPHLNSHLEGGFPVGRLVEFTGRESSTKTIHAIHVVGSFLKAYPNKIAVYIDLDKTLSIPLAKEMGVDTSRLALYSGEDLNKSIDLYVFSLRQEEVCITVFDSMSSIATSSEKEKSMEESQMTDNARVWNRGIRLIQAALNSSEFKEKGVLFINTVYTKIGGYGDPHEIRNGIGIKYAKSLSINFSALKLETIKVDNKEFYFQKIVLRTNKNKLSVKVTPTEVDFYKIGNPYIGLSMCSFDSKKFVVTLALEKGIIEQAGAWYTFNGNRFQGLSRLLENLTDKDYELILDNV